MIWAPRELARYERYALKWLPYGGRKRGCVAPRVQEVFSEEGVIQLGPADGCVWRQKAGYGKEEDREPSSAGMVWEEPWGRRGSGWAAPGASEGWQR